MEFYDPIRSCMIVHQILVAALFYSCIILFYSPGGDEPVATYQIQSYHTRVSR